MIFWDKFFFGKNRLCFDIQNWLWKYNFGTFWQTVISRRNFLKIFPWWHVDSWPKSLLLRTHHLWNSTTKLTLLLHTLLSLRWLIEKLALPMELLHLSPIYPSSFLRFPRDQVHNQCHGWATPHFVSEVGYSVASLFPICKL